MWEVDLRYLNLASPLHMFDVCPILKNDKPLVEKSIHLLEYFDNLSGVDLVALFQKILV